MRFINYLLINISFLSIKIELHSINKEYYIDFLT